MKNLYYVGTKTVLITDAAEYERLNAVTDDGIIAIVMAANEADADIAADKACRGLIDPDNAVWTFDSNSDGGNCVKTIVCFC